MLLACLLLACQKEDGITPGTGFENLYTIQDDPNDSIQHKRYELYTTYGVPVFFNDTIGKVFVKTDVNGDSVFRYETLDLNWAFRHGGRQSDLRYAGRQNRRYAHLLVQPEPPAPPHRRHRRIPDPPPTGSAPLAGEAVILHNLQEWNKKK